jgi:hypothetical protein
VDGEPLIAHGKPLFLSGEDVSELLVEAQERSEAIIERAQLQSLLKRSWKVV